MLTTRMGKKYRIAIYQNVAFGGAERAIFNLAKYLSDDIAWDLYTLKIDANIRDFYGYHKIALAENFSHIVNNHYQFADPRFSIPQGLRSFSWRNWIKYGVKLLDLSRYEKLSRQIAKAINQNGYNGVLVSICKFTQSPPVLKYLKIPSLYYCHEPNRYIYESAAKDQKRNQHIIERLYKLRLKKIDFESALAASTVLCNSYYTREYIHKTYGVFAKVSYLGVDLKTFFPRGKKVDYVLFVGPLWPAKGLDFAIRSLGLVEKSIRPRFIIAYGRGSVAYREQLQTLATEHEVDVEFKSQINDQQLSELYSHARAVLYPPIMEPFGLVALEAFACGTLVIGIKEGGLRETIVDGQTGFLVDRDERMFADAITQVLNNEEMARRMGKDAREYVENYWGWDTAAERLKIHIDACFSCL